MDGVGEALPIAGRQPDGREGDGGRNRVGDVEHEIDATGLDVGVENLGDVVAHERFPLRDRAR